VPYSVILQQFTCEKQMESRLSLCFVPLKRHFMLIPVVVANVLAHWWASSPWAKNIATGLIQ